MKKNLLLFSIVFILLVYTNGIQAQTTETKLNQVELMKQFVGRWQHDISKDTIAIWECQQYGNAFVSNMYRIINGKESFLLSENWVFSPKENKFFGFLMLPSGNYGTWISSFTDEKKWAGDYLLNFNPNEVIGKFELTLDTSTKIIAASLNKDGKIMRVKNWLKIN